MTTRLHVRSVAMAGAVLLSVAAISGCSMTKQQDTPATTTTSSSTSARATSPAPATSAASATSPAPATSTPPVIEGGPASSVDINQTFTDPGMNVSITVQKAETTWVKALPLMDVGASFVSVRMTGVRISVDSTKSDFLGPNPDAGNFDLIAADGKTTANCQPLLSGSNQSYTDAIMAALGVSGDTPYPTTGATRTPQGWFVCMTLPSTDAAFNTPGYTIHYKRGAGKTAGSGTVIPEFTFDAKVAA